MTEHEQKVARMRELGDILREAAKAYYQQGDEIMSNLEYDRLYDELLALEEETGMVLSGSPTAQVGYAAVDELPKERHAAPMLSLDKTKDREALRAFIGDHKTLLSWKLDGLTIVLTYRDGALEKAVTRGNGEIGEVVTNNAKTFVGIPLKIPYRGDLVLRGEAVISYPDFDRINEEIPETEARYKNPRNLCSGSVRQLNSEITAARSVRFFAFALVQAPGVDFAGSHEKEFEWLAKQGFPVVEYRVTDGAGLDEALDWFSGRIASYEIPSDGLVALYDDIEYGISLGRTAKFPRNAMAFKWKDELRETTLLEVEWSPSRTGLINPVAVFSPVELEGTTVSRASVHNVSIVRSLALGIGDVITVYKANMIIPQIADNLTRSGTLPIPEVCPVCGGPTSIHAENGAETLHCENPDCQAKKIKAFTLFVSRDAMNIDGLSEMTLEKLIGAGLIHSFADIFRLADHADRIAGMEGYGEKSCRNLLEGIERARHTTLPRLLFALGIPNVGASNAKVICRAFDYDPARVASAPAEALAAADGIGPVIARSVTDWFADEKNRESFEALLAELVLEEPERDAAQSLAGKTFVITGSVHHFANRSAAKAAIEAAGGKVSGSVSAKTDFLVNNDTASGSAKNRAAKQLQIPIITEEQLLAMLGEE